MKGKILIGSIFVVLMLLIISYATAVNTRDAENKESPLYKIRTKKIVSEKIKEILENINFEFLGKRVFFLPFRLLNRENYVRRDVTEDIACTKGGTCTFATNCPPCDLMEGLGPTKYYPPDLTCDLLCTMGKCGK